MLNIIDLEARWLRYKIKSYMPYFVLTLSLIFLLAFSFFYLNKEEAPQIQEAITPQETQEVAPLEPQKVVPKVATIIETVAPTEPTPTQTPTEETTQQADPQAAVQETQAQESQTLQSIQKVASREERIFTPSMGFMNEIRSQSQSFPQQQNITTQTREEFNEREENFEEITLNEEVLPSRAKEIYEEEPQTKQETQSKKINIKRQNIEEDIAGIVLRFKKSNNPALSLFIAKKYYELGDYSNAYNYALITNDINRDIEASWLLFSKSLVKLGKKELAIKTLREYTSTSKSSSAKLLLDEIESGKFK